jgi:hypothetical protein
MTYNFGVSLPDNQTFLLFFFYVTHVDRVGTKTDHSINNQDTMQKCGAHAGLVINLEKRAKKDTSNLISSFFPSLSPLLYLFFSPSVLSVLKKGEKVEILEYNKR